ncbi:aminoglycoside phosphotransferase family protein [Myxococcota bacterium]|nr:aminoglycoside phosphotransferase family protein [Myxococcota bacterium]
MDFLGDDGPELCEHVRRAARWLIHLHRAPLRIGEPDTLWESLKLMRILHRITKASARAPVHRRQMIEMVRALADRGERISDESPLVLTHGRYHYEHVFVDGSAVSVIDFDRVRPSDPAKDIAEFVSLLRHRTFKRTGSVEKAEAPTRAFLEEYLSVFPEYAENLPVYWGASLLMTVFHYVKKSSAAREDVRRRLEFYESEFELAISNRLVSGI